MSYGTNGLEDLQRDIEADRIKGKITGCMGLAARAGGLREAVVHTGPGRIQTEISPKVYIKSDIGKAGDYYEKKYGFTGAQFLQ